MKHLLNYYREQTLNNGDKVRLEFYREYPDDWLPDPLTREIGDVLAGLRLDIEGGMDDIDTPIVKTSLTFSVVDAPEKQTYWTAPKTGDWEEFYTTSATGWKVVLLGRKSNESSFRALWGGYVTPDSYTETLQHHGVVTITARDNIGYLQAFDFDAEGNAEGMITPYELITQAWEKIASPMELDWRGVADSNEWPQTGGVDANDTYINVAAFEGKTWYDAVNDTLYSLGLVMRYVGKNKVAVCPLRRMPYQGLEYMEDLLAITPRFVAYGTRELVPAVREITEEVKYELEEGATQPLVQDADFTGAAINCPITIKDELGHEIETTVAVHPIANKSEIGWGNIPSNTLFFSPRIYGSHLWGNQTTREQMFLAANSKNRMVWYGKAMQMGSDIKLKIERGVILKRKAHSVYYLTAKASASLIVIIKLTSAGYERFYNGNDWSSNYSELTIDFGQELEYSMPISLQDLKGDGILQVFITGASVGIPENADAKNEDLTTGAYLGIKSMTFSLSDTLSRMSLNKVTTKYSADNNVKISRSPKLGPVYDVVPFPALISNGIYRKEGEVYEPAKEWVWPYDKDTEPMQLAGLVHKQLLMFHSKVNNLLSGTIINADMINPRVVWTWKGKEHLLLSGSYNFLTAQLEGATLREFVRYEDLW